MPPGEDSIETCHIPLILLTAKTSDEDRVEGYESGPMVISVNRSASLSCLQDR